VIDDRFKIEGVKGLWSKWVGIRKRGKLPNVANRMSPKVRNLYKEHSATSAQSKEIHTYVCTLFYAYMHACVCMHYLCTNKHTSIREHTYIRTYIHTFIHTYM